MTASGEWALYFERVEEAEDTGFLTKRGPSNPDGKDGINRPLLTHEDG